MQDKCVASFSKIKEIMNVSDEIEPYVIETGVEGLLAEGQLQIITRDIIELLKVIILDYSVAEPSDRQIDSIADSLQSTGPSDRLRIARILGWELWSETEMHETGVRPRGYRLLKYVARIPMNTSRNVVGQFENFQHISTAAGQTAFEKFLPQGNIHHVKTFTPTLCRNGRAVINTIDLKPGGLANLECIV